MAALILFVLVGTIISGLCESLHQARDRIQADERRRAEEALRESEHRWRNLTEALPQLVWSATPDGACDYFSTQWTEYTGVPEEGLLGWRCARLGRDAAALGAADPMAQLVRHVLRC